MILTQASAVLVVPAGVGGRVLVVVLVDVAAVFVAVDVVVAKIGKVGETGWTRIVSCKEGIPIV